MNTFPINGSTPQDSIDDDLADARYEARRRRQLGLPPVGACPECEATGRLHTDESGVVYCGRCNWREDGT